MTARWDHHFLKLCLTISEMSRDPNTRVGALIVGPDKEIRSSGFNGFPRGVADTPERLYDRELKLRLMVHAERNALLNAARIGVSTKGCTLYLVASDGTIAPWGGSPCTSCVIEIIQAGIAEVVSWPFKNVPSRWADDIAFAATILAEAGVRYREIGA
jgi:dCMP deaminase